MPSRRQRSDRENGRSSIQSRRQRQIKEFLGSHSFTKRNRFSIQSRKKMLISVAEILEAGEGEEANGEIVEG